MQIIFGLSAHFLAAKPHRRICIPQGARNVVLQETQPEPQHIFRRCFFARQGFSAAAVYAYRKAQETKFYGKLSPNLSSFFDDVFSQDKENERRRTSVLQAKFDAVFGKLSPNLSSFFGDVFLQDKENERWRTVGTPSEI